MSPLPHDDHSPTDAESRASSLTKPPGRAWFDDDDTREPIDPEIAANQTDDDGTDE